MLSQEKGAAFNAITNADLIAANPYYDYLFETADNKIEVNIPLTKDNFFRYALAAKYFNSLTN